MKRSKHSLSNYKLLTCDMGKLIPIGLIEALPGDTIQQSSSALIRMSPMLAPVMHPVQVRIHHWFVPHRLSMGSTWENFITGGADGLGDGSAIPTNAAIYTPAVGGIGDYLGLPTGVALPAGTVSLLPFYGYRLIYNEFYRDQDLAAVMPNTPMATLETVQNIAWEKDYFTAARPWAQKGPAVTLPLGTSAVVRAGATDVVTGAQANALRLRSTASGSFPGAQTNLGINTSGGVEAQGAGVAGSGSYYPTNLTADLQTATAAQVTDLRRALALQRYQEARAQYGSRYTEYLRYIGIRPQDARLDRPEYLGGGKQTIAFSEVLRTGNVTADATPNVIGQLKGHGIAALRSNRYRYFVQEHGYVISVMSVRPRSIYSNGIERTWLKRSKEDFYQKELELVGQQVVTNAEVFAGAVDATNKLTFGYQDRYSEYRHQASMIAGDFRGTLNFWHLARQFGALPTLNQAFIDCAPGKRIFADTTGNSCWVMVNNQVQARRMVGRNVIGRVM